MGTVILAIAIGIFLVVDLACGFLMSVVLKKKKEIHQYIFPGYSIYSYYKYKKDHIK